MPTRCRWQLPTLILVAMLCLSGCGAETPLAPANHSPVVLSLIAFPTTIGPGDSAIVVCTATDADGDTVVFDWYSDCRLIKQWQGQHDGIMYGAGNTMVVHAGTCVDVPVDTGWISCSVRDGWGGGAYAGTMYIIISQ